MNVTADAMGDLLILFLVVVMATIVAAIFGMTSHKDEREDKACAVQEGTGHQSPHT
jgi:hypothetical protein